ncbi:MFS transporter [Umezawaea sp. Da 62-37]|uniref:MFS transporter n=1 Tax=Umezawaea sp. Da 62-37 TaxID=3075927 RepID=UPI0028F71683|nr:MFS transporter [Umezawaea sp. Da 62-37]WNV85276.1 MFS transporter [Umezawaea sp. Da 62-37]
MSDRLLGPTAPGSTREPGTLQLLLLLAGSCMPILGAVLIAPVLPQITAAFSTVAGVEVLVPIVLTVPALVVGLAAPFAGLLADAVDRKRVLIVAMVVYSVVGTAPLYLDTIQTILVSRVLVGVCEAAIMTCCTTLIGDYWSGDRRRRYLGLQTLVTALSATVFLGLGGALGAAGWRTPFWLYLAAAVIAIPMIRAIWQPERAARATRTLEPVPWRGLAVPCLVTLFGGIVFYALIVELSFVLDGVGVTSTAVIGAISALMSVATAVGAGSFARLAKHGTRTLLAVGFGLAAIGLVTVFSTSTIAVITLGAAFTGLGTGLLLPTLLTWAVDRLTFAQRGRGTGLWTGSFFIGQFLSPLVIVAVGAGVGGLRPALGLLGVASLIAVPAVLVGLRRTTQEVSP